MNLIDMLQQFWHDLLTFMTQFIIPDWGALIALLPILIFLGVVGPLLSICPLVVLIYQARKPRVSMRVVEGPQLATIGADGEPIFPPGLPYCRRDGLIYASGTQQCDRCRDDLLVICPMCSLGRDGRHRYLHQLRPGPQGQAPRGRRARLVRATTRRRRGRLSGRPPTADGRARNLTCIPRV